MVMALEETPPPPALAGLLLLAQALAVGPQVAAAIVSASSSSTINSDELPAVSRSHLALGAQDFQLIVSDAGTATLVSSSLGANDDDDGSKQQQHLTTVSSAWSSPGPVWNEFTESAAAPAAGSNWTVTVDRSHAAEGMWLVQGKRKEFTVQRAYILDPPPPQKPRRVLVNDTLSTPIATGPGLQWTATPTYEDIIGISVRHRATVAVTAAEVESAVVPGECHHPFVIACVWRRTE